MNKLNKSKIIDLEWSYDPDEGHSAKLAYVDDRLTCIPSVKTSLGIYEGAILEFMIRLDDIDPEKDDNIVLGAVEVVTYGDIRVKCLILNPSAEGLKVLVPDEHRDFVVEVIRRINSKPKIIEELLDAGDKVRTRLLDGFYSFSNMLDDNDDNKMIIN